MRLVVATRAQRDVVNTITFYNDQAPGLAQDFLDEVEAAFQQIVELPGAGAPYHQGTRRLVLRRFPYVVIHRVKAERIEVVAVAHERRRPDYWA